MIPTIDPRVRHVGTTFLRTLTAAALKVLDGAIVVSDNEKQLAVILPFDTFMAIQEKARMYDAGGIASERYQSLLPDTSSSLDAIGPGLSSGKGKATTETVRRGIRQKGDEKR